MKSFDPKAYASMPKISFVDNLISVLFQICNDLWNVYSSSNKECVHIFDPLVPEKKKCWLGTFISDEVLDLMLCCEMSA